MSKSDIKIDESTHETVRSIPKRIGDTLLSLGLGFLLINIIAFWMFPGVGIGSLYLFSSAHSSVAIVGQTTTVLIYTFLAICGVLGWFRGKSFTDRLKGYISMWKFW